MKEYKVWAFARSAAPNLPALEEQLAEVMREADRRGYIIVNSCMEQKYGTEFWRPALFAMPNDTIVDLIRTLIWYDWEHSLPFQDFGDSTQCFLLRIRLSCSHPAVKALLADWQIHRTAFENGRITSSDYLEWMLQWPPTLSAPDD